MGSVYTPSPLQALSTLKQKVKKYNKDFEDSVSHCRANPDQYQDEEEEEEEDEEEEEEEEDDDEVDKGKKERVSVKQRDRQRERERVSNEGHILLLSLLAMQEMKRKLLKKHQQ